MMKFDIFSQIIVTSIFGISLSVCSAQEIPADWKMECVGRLQLSFPSEVDVAGYTFKKLEEQIDGGGEPQFQFQDGSAANWSSLQYGGLIYTSNSLEKKEYSELEIHMKKWMENSRLSSLNRKNEDAKNRQFEILATNPQTGMAWHVDERYRAFLSIRDHVFLWNVTGRSSKNQEPERSNLSTIVNGLSYRSLYAVPRTAGVCLPFFFIRDNDLDKNLSRVIAMTYRLKSHPDVTIMLEDATADQFDSEKREKISEPDYVIDDFWTQYRSPDASIRSLWEFPIKRSVTLAGQKGLASFVKITREGNIDYGYFATVRGDPKAKTDTPDLRLYVIQEGSKAKAKGIEPIGKEEFLKMAETIAASVQRRPTQ
ncbi:hypothetical protein LT85_1397 [Collimonas arenae]|uniref:Tle cognate immunity protein 4 C-terminal domain-containing protein n=1 Tax=Collimonas arenae TaxID=279058 RepID=A0A0A1F9U0_9BURK|nr:hypothetical protein [Collimonas arenae]AIY40555.1 hypothetical protein LT85_1397 [Collimonas arenae]